MRVVILGSGVVGVTSAYYLARAGHEVTVIDREAGPALETSFANAGQISPGYASPWAAPGVPLKAVKWMFQKHAPLAIRLDGTAFQLQWMWQMLQNCTPDRYAVNKGRMVRLAEYSRDCLQALRADTGIEYEGRTRRHAAGVPHAAAVRRRGEGHRRAAGCRTCRIELLSPAELAQAEPALAAVSHKLTGGLRLPNDETGDCQMFTTRLAAMAEATRRQVPLQHADRRARVSGDRIAGVQCGERTGARRLVRGRARLVFDRSSSCESGQDSGLSAEGLFDHRADRQRRRRAGVHRARRNVQDRDHAFRRPDSRRRHGGDRRLTTRR